MIEKIADDLIGQMTEARLIDKEMEARYVVNAPYPVPFLSFEKLR